MEKLRRTARWDPYDRFEYGVPPKKNGDYAFFLHVIRSLKSTGKAAVILPHGVLFRGNSEAHIRKNLIQRGYIKAIIGLPANLFYGTGIPACIVVVDKENAAGRKGIFMIDASKGFIKDGNKNRLREQDIHKIVDTDATTGEARRGFIDVLAELGKRFPNPDQIIKESDKKDFAKLFGEYLRVENILQNYDEFVSLKSLQDIDLNDVAAVEDFKAKHHLSDDNMAALKEISMPAERKIQDYKSTYNDIRDWLRREKASKEKEKSDIDWNDVVFEVDLLKSQEINLDYILEQIFEKNKKVKDKPSLMELVSASNLSRIATMRSCEARDFCRSLGYGIGMLYSIIFDLFPRGILAPLACCILYSKNLSLANTWYRYREFRASSEVRITRTSPFVPPIRSACHIRQGQMLFEPWSYFQCSLIFCLLTS